MEESRTRNLEGGSEPLKKTMRSWTNGQQKTGAGKRGPQRLFGKAEKKKKET